MQLTADIQSKMLFTLPVPAVGRCLMVTCGALRLAMPAALIRGILSREKAADLRAAAALEQISEVVELAARLEQPILPETAESRIILVGRSETHAFRVETIHGYTDVRNHQRRPLPPHFMGKERQWFGGLILFEETIAVILNSYWLLGEETEWEDDPWPATTGAEVLELEVACDGDETPWADL